MPEYYAQDYESRYIRENSVPYARDAAGYRIVCEDEVWRRACGRRGTVKALFVDRDGNVKAKFEVRHGATLLVPPNELWLATGY